MQIYRAIKPLSTGHQAGDIVLGADLRDGVAEVLVKRGALVVASTPPLCELPGWVLRSEGLAEVGIVSIPALLSANEEAIIRKFNLRRGSTVERWKQEALGWLTAPAKRNCRGC
jgi:hypothetical protein